MSDFPGPFDDDDGEFPIDDFSGPGFNDDAPDDFELDPINFGTVEIAPGVFATITVDPGVVFDPVDINLSGLYDLLGVEPQDVIPGPIPDDFDRDNPDVRGPFHDLESLVNFMRETGLGDFGDAFFDADTDEFFFEITGTE